MGNFGKYWKWKQSTCGMVQHWTDKSANNKRVHWEALGFWNHLRYQLITLKSSWMTQDVFANFGNQLTSKMNEHQALRLRTDLKSRDLWRHCCTCQSCEKDKLVQLCHEIYDNHGIWYFYVGSALVIIDPLYLNSIKSVHNVSINPLLPCRLAIRSHIQWFPF